MPTLISLLFRASLILSIKAFAEGVDESIPTLYNSSSTDIKAKVTFYGAKDNCPPGGDIAYPKIHKKAGGKGTYSDPITFAGAEKSIAPGSIVYISKFKKYFIFEDECEECQEDWSSSKMYHLDLWMGPTYAVDGVIDCENQLSDDKVSTTVTLNPASTLAVNTTAFFDETRSKYNGCIEKPDTCTDAGTKCGNECKTPSAQSCSQLASLYGLAIDRFKALNCNTKYNVDCSTTVPKGKTTCMGGTCGDRR